MSRDNRISGNCGGGGIESFARFLINTRTIFRLCGRTTRVSNDNNDRRSERDGERARIQKSSRSRIILKIILLMRRQKKEKRGREC